MLPMDMKKLREHHISQRPCFCFHRHKRDSIPECCAGCAHILAQRPHNPVGSGTVSEDADRAWMDVSPAMGWKVRRMGGSGKKRGGGGQ